MRPIRSPITRLWKLVRGTGLERCELQPSLSGWMLNGAILRLHDGIPIEARYAIVCDVQWRSIKAEIRVRDDVGERCLYLEKFNGEWMANGERKPLLNRLVDIDLGWSPSTNSLAIRRLNLGLGQHGTAMAVWIQFPKLEIQPLAQEYKRVEEHVYLYSSNAGAFRAELVVDDDGLVEEYQDGWKLVRETILKE